MRRTNAPKPLRYVVTERYRQAVALWGPSSTLARAKDYAKSRAQSGLRCIVHDLTTGLVVYDTRWLGRRDQVWIGESAVGQKSPKTFEEAR